MGKVYWIVCFLFLLLITSCENELDIDSDKETHLDSKTQLSSYYCSNQSCLPQVTIWGDNNWVEIYWSDNDMGNDHRFHLTCEGAMGNVYMSELVSSSGGRSFSIPDLREGYKVSYSISCDNYYCYDCGASGTFNKPAGDKEGSMGSSYECFKEYYSYYIDEKFSNTVELNRITDGLENDPDIIYMDFNMVHVYESKNGSDYKQISSGQLTQISTGQFLLSGLPSDMGCEYIVSLTNSECLAEFDHYIYFTYSGTSQHVKPSFYKTQLFDMH